MKLLFIITAILLLFSCAEENKPTLKFRQGSGIGTLTDSTLYSFISYTDGSADTTYWKCKASQRDLAYRKIYLSIEYAHLNWQARKEYHELDSVRVIPFRNKGD